MNPFYILAGGYAKRSQPLSRYKPKAIFPLGGIPLINRVLSQLEGMGLEEGFINLHHKAELLKKAIKSPLPIHFHHETKLSGNQILKSSLASISDWLLVINGDVFTKIPLSRMTEMLRDTGCNGVLLTHKSTESRYSKLAIEGNRFKGILPKSANPGWMFSGVALLGKEVIAAIEETSMFTTFARHPFDIRVVSSDSIWLDLGEPRLYYESNFSYQAYRGIPTGNVLASDVRISNKAAVQDSIIWEGCTIEAGAIINDSIVVQDIHVKAESIRNKIVTPAGHFPLR